MDNFIDTINEKLGVYQERFGKLPATIVFDTVTQLYTAIQHYNENHYKGLQFTLIIIKTPLILMHI